MADEVLGDPEVETVLAEIRATIAEINGETGEIREKRVAEAAEGRKTDDELAAKRRHGDEGRDWQVVQQQIDLGKTTLSDVITGVDLSREARAIRERMQKLLPAARAQFAAIVEDGEAVGEFSGIESSRAELERAVAALNALDLGL